MISCLVCGSAAAEAVVGKQQAEVGGIDVDINAADDAVRIGELQVESLIKPYKIGDTYNNDWFFYQVEKIEKSDIVFSLKGRKPNRRLFVWLTKKNDSVGPQYQTKNYNVIFASENKSALNKEQSKIAIEIIDLIRGNDNGDSFVEEKDLLEDGGFKVVLQTEGRRKSFAFLNLNIIRIIWIVLVVMLAAVFFYKLFKGNSADETPGKNEEQDLN